MDGSTESTRRNTIQEAGPDAQLIYALLQPTQVGGTVTYAAMSTAIGRDVTKHRGPMYTALRMLRREHHMVFGVQLAEGLKRLDDAEIVGVAADGVRKMHRVARRGVKVLACADYDKLTNGARVQHNAAVSMLGTLAMLTESRAVKRVETKVAEGHVKLSTQATLAMFSS